MDLARRAGSYLEEQGVERGVLDAELLLASVLGINRLDLYLQFDRPVTPAELSGFRECVRRRARREPLQYITGSAAFREFEVPVDRRVFIPRPETEILAGEVLDWSERRYGPQHPPTASAGGTGAESVDDAGLDLLEIGTGSGAMAIALAREGPFRRVLGTDISPEAVSVAAANARLCGLEETTDAPVIEFRCGRSYEPLRPGERFDVIVSNPPYIPSAEIEDLAPEVRDWEPRRALDGGADGLRQIREIVSEASGWLAPGGLLALEVGYGQAGAVRDLIESDPTFAAARVCPDLTRRERFVLGRARPAGSFTQQLT